MPRRIVLGLKPVIRTREVIPPRPCWCARKPTNRRRRFSSMVATKRLMARCSSAIFPCGCVTQDSQGQEWIFRRRFRDIPAHLLATGQSWRRAYSTPKEGSCSGQSTYLSGKSPLLRGTLSMLGQESQRLTERPEHTPVVFLQLTWSAGDHLVG